MWGGDNGWKGGRIMGKYLVSGVERDGEMKIAVVESRWR